MTASEPPELVVGASIGPIVWPSNLESWNRFAAVNDEFDPIHMDDVGAREAGMSGAFAQGSLLVSYLHIVVREWMGARGRIVNLGMQFRKPSFKGTLTVSGTVLSVTETDDQTVATLQLSALDAEGDNVAPGNATVAFV